MLKGFVQKILWFLSTSRNAIAVIGSTIVAASLGAKDSPFTLVGEIKPGLPNFSPPPLSITVNGTSHNFMSILQEEGSAIIVIPLLAIMEHITIAKAFTKNLDASQEMIAIGLSNILGSFARWVKYIDIVSSFPTQPVFLKFLISWISVCYIKFCGLLNACMKILWIHKNMKSLWIEGIYVSMFTIISSCILIHDNSVSRYGKKKTRFHKVGDISYYT